MKHDGSHNNRYATQLYSQHKQVLVDKLKSYQTTHPYSFHKLAKFMIGVSAATLWRIANDKVERLSNSTLFHLFHFFEQREPYSIFKAAERNGNWIRFSRRSQPRFY